MTRQLERRRSTIYREIKRNTFHDHEFPEFGDHSGAIGPSLFLQNELIECHVVEDG